MRLWTKQSVMLVMLLMTALETLSAQAKKDSLWRVWNNPAAADTQRLKALQNITWPMLNTNLDSAFLLAKIQLDFATAKNNQKWIGKAYYNMASYYYLKSDYPQSIAFYNHSLEIRKKTGDLKGEAAIYGNLGLIYGDQGNNLKDLEYQLKALKINEQIRDTAGMTSNYSNLARLYQNQEDSTKAMEYYEKTLNMYSVGDNQSSISLLYNNIGNMYRGYHLFEKAQWYLMESLCIRTELQDILGMAITYLNLGTLYITKKDYAKAKTYTRQSIEYFKKLNDEASLANGYYNLGDIARRERQYQEALTWCNASLEIARSTNKMNIEAADCFCLYRTHKELGNPAKALSYLEEFVDLNDSLRNDDLKLEMSRLKFEKENLTDSISRVQELNQLNDLHELEMRKRGRITNFILVAAIGFLVLMMVFLGRMLVLQRNSASLKRKTQELENQQLVNEISLLKTQVNPHFLFNSLSILSSLVRIDPDLSEQFIEQLSRSYRYILEQKDQSLVTLRTELGFIESYAFLLKIRFENKFNLVIDLPEEMLDRYKIAPLTLQLLVENAVKHNRMSLTEPLIVTIALDENQMLVVKNKLQPRSTPTKSTGVGLQNIMNRYALLTDRPVWAGETEDQFVIKIPLLDGQQFQS
jgi:tetratricopeptide (TPR) repeat protein